MSSKEFCESGKHSYNEVDIVKTILAGEDVYIVIACSKCDSQFLRKVDKPLP